MADAAADIAAEEVRPGGESDRARPQETAQGGLMNGQHFFVNGLIDHRLFS
jgi:hypothetical protein